MTINTIDTISSSRIDRFSPRKMARVSLPMIRSPCMSRMSKNRVLKNTKPVDHTKIEPLTQMILPLADKGGRRATTIPHAMAIRMVFEPGISLILRYLMPCNDSGSNGKLYDSPIMLMVSRRINDQIPAAKAINKPAPPATIAARIKRCLYKQKECSMGSRFSQ